MMRFWSFRLIAANVVMFLLTYVGRGLFSALQFQPAHVLDRPWTIITYMFLHADFSHILFNMLGLYFFGPRVELELGSRRFLTLYFLSGIAGAVLSLVFAPHSAIVGASGAIFGVFLAFAYHWPREPIYIWGILPVEARWMVVGMTALSLFGGFGGGGDGIAHFAHLGGYIGAYAYLKFLDSRAGARLREGGFVVPTTTPGRGAIERWGSIDREKLHEVNRDELDRIRAKLMTTGPASLTPQEIAFLERFSA
jgi:membrane associated rhomboid family serine protease